MSLVLIGRPRAVTTHSEASLENSSCLWEGAVCVCAQSLSYVWLFATVACQAPLFIEFSRQEYQSVLPFPTPWDLLHPGMELMFLTSPALAGRFFTTAPLGKSWGLKMNSFHGEEQSMSWIFRRLSWPGSCPQRPPVPISNFGTEYTILGPILDEVSLEFWSSPLVCTNL